MLWQAENIYIIATILEEDRHITCEEITTESAIPESFFHHVLTEVLKRKVNAFSMTMQDIISHKLHRMFSPITTNNASPWLQF